MVGVAGRSFAELSPRWLAFCRQLIDEFGPVFKRVIPIPPLAHITVQLTTIDAASLVTIYVRDRVANSAIALSGGNPQAEREALTRFVDSLRRTLLVQQAAPNSKPFEAAFTLNDRPLYIVVPWPDPQISDEDQALVLELDNHLAAAILDKRSA